MKTLYITDLDGTLLNSNAQISRRSAEIINELTQKGVLFSLSTARTHATVSEMFSEIPLNIPLVMMNGVLVYDPNAKKIISSTCIDKDSALKVLEVFKKHGKDPMLYYENGSKIRIYYKDLDNKFQQDYINGRNDSGVKEFYYTTSFEIKNNLIYIVTLDPREELQDIYDEICKIEGVNCMFYSDNYTGCYFLEVMSSKVSKGTGAKFVKEYVGADKMIAFGDNLNDIPLFEASDECYAVENAHPKLKGIATGIIGRNDDDAVPLFIKNNENLNGVE